MLCVICMLIHQGTSAAPTSASWRGPSIKLEGPKYNAQTDRMREIYARPGGTQDGDADKRSAHWMSGRSLVLPQKATYPAMSGFGPWRRVILLHLVVEKATEVL